MAVRKTNYFSLFLLLVIASVSSQDCSSDSACSPNGPLIRFPFRLRHEQPRRCGYDPGFDLDCDNLNSTIIKLKNSGLFTVQAIDYSLQQIWLNDPDNCLPQRLLSLNLSGSPFTGVNVQSFWLYNCSFNSTSSRFRFNPVSCLSDSNHTVFATSSPRASSILSNSCDFIATVPVPTQLPFLEMMRSTDLSDDIRLAWTDPECGRCESRGERCSLKSNSATDIQCQRRNVAGLSRGAQYAISIGVGVPVLLLIGGLICIICHRLKGHNYNRRRRIATVEHALSMTPLPQPPRIILGLDDPTIESYPKTVLGESKRLPKAGDNICSICLSEYKPNNILRTIPTCQHTFHADCIDEWLRLNASCPVCRKSPRLQQSL